MQALLVTGDGKGGNVVFDSLDRDPAVTLQDAYQSWRSSATDADLLRAVFLVEQRSGQAAKALRRLDVGGGVLVPAEWPADVAAVFARALPPPPTVADLPAPWPLLMAETIDAQIPALFETLSGMKMSELLGKVQTIGDSKPKPDSPGSIGKGAGS